jgi:hypothetical protein
MKVLNPDDTTHEVKYIYRRSAVGSKTFALINELTKEEEVFTPDFEATYSGITNMMFTKTVNEGSRYIFKVTDTQDTIYIGKIFVTDQVPKSYNKTKDYIVYE